MDILIRGGRLLSGEPADVLVSDGVIAAVGVVADRPAEVIDASGLHVGPGLVDGHRHVWQSPLRGAGADMTLPDYFGAVLGRALPRYRAQDANLAALLGAAEALDAGVTTVFDWCNVPHVDAVLDAYATAGIRAVVAAADRAGARAVAGRAGLVTGAMAVFAPQETVADELRFARDLGLFASMHANGGPGGGLDRLDAAGLLGPWLQLVHVNAMTAEDAHRLADTGTGVTVTPVVEATMGHGESPYTRFLAAGGRAGLGTDVVVNAPPDLFEPMRETLRRHRAESGTMAPAGSVLAAATADSAAAIGLGAVAGAVAVGRPADLVLFSGLDHLAGDVTGALVTTLGPADVHTVLVDGRVVKRDGRLVSLDLAALRASAAEVGRRVLR
ncbi:amidohydrolase family protein [Dactylosporangium vinaceum]|uniref:Amidohydrolase family protein n=1 Tax=Dactylosporangium vinaceum TaxID=53362 RepID=A0ABV5M1U4_9ACTN|nr:amidohydrolase family protein [Dactylosporangium vinaceum]UAB99286.1 amidohydrolase family protein [Dactylosporangium vinaceum]